MKAYLSLFDNYAIFIFFVWMGKMNDDHWIFMFLFANMRIFHFFLCVRFMCAGQAIPLLNFFIFFICGYPRFISKDGHEEASAKKSDSWKQDRNPPISVKEETKPQ